MRIHTRMFVCLFQWEACLARWLGRYEDIYQNARICKRCEDKRIWWYVGPQCNARPGTTDQIMCLSSLTTRDQSIEKCHVLEFQTTLTISSFAAWPAVGWMGSSTFRSQITQSHPCRLYCNHHLTAKQTAYLSKKPSFQICLRAKKTIFL